MTALRMVSPPLCRRPLLISAGTTILNGTTARRAILRASELHDKETRDRKQAQHSDQRKRATCLGQSFGLRSRSRLGRRRSSALSLGGRCRRRSRRRRVLRHFLLLRLTLVIGGADRRRRQIRFLLGVRGRNLLMCFLRYLYGHGLGIGEFLSEVIAGIEPGAESFGLSRRGFPKLQLRLSGGFQPVVGDRENGGLQMLFVLVEDLNDVAV